MMEEERTRRYQVTFTPKDAWPRPDLRAVLTAFVESWDPYYTITIDELESWHVANVRLAHVDDQVEGEK